MSTSPDLNAEQLAVLLDRHHAGDADAGSALFVAIDAHFRQHLKPWLVRWFREAAGDTSVRYTAMANTFFAEVLGKGSDPFWQQKSLQAMRGYAAKAIANDMRDVLRRRKKREPIGEDELIELAENRALHLAKWKGLELDRALDLEVWDRRPAPWPLRATLLRLRYVIGMTYEEIGEQMELPRSTVKDHHDRAIDALRQELADGRPEALP